MKFFRFFLPALIVALGLVAVTTKVDAAQIKTAKVTLADSRSGATGVAYDFSFLHTSAASIKKFTFDFCKLPSGDTHCTTPIASTGLTSVTATSFGGLSVPLGATGNWSITVVDKMITFYNNAGTVNLSANDSVTVTINAIANSTLAEACDATTGTDTCFIWIKSYNDAGGIIDTGVVTYTIVDAVTVTAKVDPTFTFVVAGVGAGTANNGISTSVASTANTLPFGSLTAGTQKYAAHALYVTTNTQSGYTVDAKMATQMTGVYTSNNIDPFVAAWTSPTTWTEPTGGTPNDNTGWIGGNTTDTDVTGWSTEPTGKFGSISSTAVIVSQKSSSDNGLAPVYVTYAIEANVFQPSDSYQGTLIYNALPTY